MPFTIMIEKLSDDDDDDATMLKRIRMKMTMTNVSKIDNWKGASHKKQIVDDQIRR